MADTRTVVVVGGGIAGLSAAWALCRAGDPGSPRPRLVVLEASERVGGALGSTRVGGREVDAGPDAFVARRPEARELCEELGLGPELVAPGTSGASIWARDRLRAMPADLALGVPTRLRSLARSGILDPRGLARAALDPLGWTRRHRGDGSSDRAVGEIVRRRLGPQVQLRLADPLIGGIHAGTTDAMSAAAVFPPLLGADGDRSLMRGLRRAQPAPAPGPTDGAPSGTPMFLRVRGGMARLPVALHQALTGRGVEIRTRARVDELAQEDGAWSVGAGGDRLRADGLVLAAPADEAARLLAPLPGSCRELAARLGEVEHAEVAVVTLAFGPGALPPLPPGTGFLVPAEQGLLVTGCTFLSVKWPELAAGDQVLIRASAGRYGDRRAAGLDDDALVARVGAELAALLGAAPPSDASVVRWPRAFPQYRVGHVEAVEAMDRAAAQAPAPLALAGATYRGVGVPACVGTGRAAAAAVLARLRAGADPP